MGELDRGRAGWRWTSDGSIFVSETESNRIRKYRFGPPPPEPGKSGQVEVTRGTVKVKKRGSDEFVELEDAGTFPLGSVVDTTKGTIDLTVDAGRRHDAGGRGLEGDVQDRPDEGLAEDHRDDAPGRQLQGVQGARRAGGEPQAEVTQAVREGEGTLPLDRPLQLGHRARHHLDDDRLLLGTRVKVTSGSVTVRDLKRKRNVTVRKGKSYLVRPPR